VRHKHVSITMDWKPEKVQLADYRNLISRYFVRTTADAAAVESVFGEVSYVQAEGITGETAFVTGSMDGYAYEAAAAKLDGILQCIRVK
ncbi:MAG: homoserine dehydrogenase, partial [Clostridiales bacterium]|nr:homoserine dehydrogenase [Clostridiales bacterium]